MFVSADVARISPSRLYRLFCCIVIVENHILPAHVSFHTTVSIKYQRKLQRPLFKAQVGPNHHHSTHQKPATPRASCNPTTGHEARPSHRPQIINTIHSTSRCHIWNKPDNMAAPMQIHSMGSLRARPSRDTNLDQSAS